MSWFRRPSLPDDVRRALHLPAGDRVLASAELRDGSWAVATRGSLVTSDPTGRAVVARPWSDVDRASYAPEASTITVTWVDGTPPLALHLVDPRRSGLVPTLRERVQSSVVLAETVTFAAGRTARVAVRRDRDGALFSQVVAEPGVDLHDPEVAARVDAAEGRVRSRPDYPSEPARVLPGRHGDAVADPA
ncbi:hypothetical protein [Cellulosimicrobium sp. CUA-896]|uniref:hypothetical protein n=1 Tax=Cellulosimicrobium sp. CUA-896 TaxID=1517881 RepID=UPI000968B818|nr:hypothetical protein [Cellulosimicrobium sp. CUA-896]OLT54015.1 hypothetical protein BJF88_00595 [Cellulosimicrobium sp. CUA-896]